MTKYVWDRWGKQWVPAADIKRSNKPDAPAVISDMEEYRAIGIKGAPMITSRSQHRQVLRENNMVEVGNMPMDQAKKTFNVWRG